jgi:osmotically inducible protein OsmC
MPTAQRQAEVTWEGNLVQGRGQIVKTGSGVLNDLPITWASRIERPDGRTSPEELIAAAHASCYAMAFSNTLAQEGKTPERLDVTAVCTLELGAGGARITSMDLEVRGKVPGLDQAGFEQAAQKAEQGCPVSNALRGGLTIRVKATLE